MTASAGDCQEAVIFYVPSTICCDALSLAN